MRVYADFGDKKAFNLTSLALTIHEWAKEQNDEMDISIT